MAKNVGNPDGHTSYRISTPPDQGGEQGLGEDSSDGLELSASTSTPPLTSQGHRQTTDSVGSASHRGFEPTWHTHTTSSRAVAHGSQAAVPRPRGNHSASRSSRKPAAAPQQADPVDVEEDLLAAFEKELFRDSAAVAVPGSPIPLQDLTIGRPIDDKNPPVPRVHCIALHFRVGRSGPGIKHQLCWRGPGSNSKEKPGTEYQLCWRGPELRSRFRVRSNGIDDKLNTWWSPNRDDKAFGCWSIVVRTSCI